MLRGFCGGVEWVCYKALFIITFIPVNRLFVFSDELGGWVGSLEVGSGELLEFFGFITVVCCS